MEKDIVVFFLFLFFTSAPSASLPDAQNEVETDRDEQGQRYQNQTRYSACILKKHISKLLYRSSQ